ncbi:hypothetical protein H2200_000732 [Cladophialophora chaetospira]|uniref:Uncharacterized protein n=1 Tax=Cladophialophora chaetospira TaxID=386627 RepID=A0AA38XPC5_9EURO|nr:hypothetical protein H2200_000732 [Cladophialophora chaetospira]
MSSPTVLKRPRGRPRKNPLPASAGLLDTLRQPTSLRVSLRYNPGKKCLCMTSIQLGPYLCAHHGIHDNKSKGPPHKEAGYTQSPNKRKRDEDEEECWDMFPETPATPKPQPIQRGNRIDPTQYGDVELCLLKNLVQNLPNEFDPERFFGRLPQPDIEPLTQLDFLDTPLEARKLIYRYLLTFADLNPELQTNIVLTNRQVYKESIPILYGENCFVARETSDFFPPNGIKQLRRTTAQRIKHIMILRSGRAEDCNITSQELADSLHSMVLQSPAFLKLQTVSIRFEVRRPAHVNLFQAQMYLQQHGVDPNFARTLYKKHPTIVDAAARLAWKALEKKSPFHKLMMLEDADYAVQEGGQNSKVNVSKVCLVRNKELALEYSDDRDNLYHAIVNMLLDEMSREVQGAEARWDWFKRYYPN